MYFSLKNKSKLLFSTLSFLFISFGVLVSSNNYKTPINASDQEVDEDWTVIFDFSNAQSWWRDCTNPNPQIQYFNLGAKDGFVELTEVSGTSRNKWQTSIYKESLNYNGDSFLLRVCGSYGNNNQTVNYNARTQFRNPNNNYATLVNPGNDITKTLNFSQENVTVRVFRKDTSVNPFVWIKLADTTWPKYNHEFNPGLIYSRLYNAKTLYTDTSLSIAYTPTKLTQNQDIYMDDILAYDLTDDVIRIPVVRPTFWNVDESIINLQVLRISSIKTSLETNNPTLSQLSDITYFLIRDFNADTYYTPTSSGFTTSDGGYATDGVVFYDLPYSLVNGKYYDLARINAIDPIFEGTTIGSIFNRTSGANADTLTSTKLNRIWEIFNNGSGIFMPSTNAARSRVVSNDTVANILEAYQTCSSSIYNGYGAFPVLNDHFDLVSRDYTGFLINDYSGVGTSGYGSGRGAGTSTPLEDKVNRMEFEYEQSLVQQNSPRIQSQNQSPNLVLQILMLISLVSFIYFFIKKRNQLSS